MANKENVVTAFILKGKNNISRHIPKPLSVVTALILKGKNNRH